MSWGEDSAVTWKNCSFSELSADLLYQLLMLRQQVFIVEQQCPYADADGWDSSASHLLAFAADATLIACCRMLPPGSRYAEASIGRVVVHSDWRRRGLGHELIERATTAVRAQFPEAAIRIGAQSHLVSFYGRHGYQPVGEQYPVDRIPHQDLLLSTKETACRDTR
ncbi:MAG: GNAT family N-acetyltransferase [Planctomycetaceae bacterium]|nr:GNAT family N-acetyltransferase [Planctomycetaceae bacterium]